MSSSVASMPASRSAPSSPPVPAGPCRVECLDTTRERDWDVFVRSHPEGTLFHTSSWRRAVEEVFPHEPVYLTARRGTRLVGVLPMFLVNSRLAGRMLVSVPYGVGGGILAEDGEAAERLFVEARAVAEEAGCRSIDFRSERAQVPSLPVVETYAGFKRTLPERVEDVLGFLPRKARAAARHARDRYRLTAVYGDEHLHEVWRLYALNMRRLGSIVYPPAFFRRLVAHTPGKHWVMLVRWGNRPVAGLLTFLFRDTVMPYFFGCTPEARRCHAANFTYLKTMERAVAAGYRQFDFGRSRRDNPGSFNFKRFQGFEPRPLGYQVWTPPGRTPPDLSPTQKRIRFARRIWRHLPLWMTNRLGAWASKHIPG